MGLNLDLVAIEISGNSFSVKCLSTQSALNGEIINGEIVPTRYAGKVNLFKPLCDLALDFNDKHQVGMMVIEHLPAN